MRRDINDSLCRNLADQTRPSSSSRAVSSVICLKLQSDLIPVGGSREGIDLLSCSLFEHFFFFFGITGRRFVQFGRLCGAIFHGCLFEGIIEVSVCQVLNIILFLQRGDREALSRFVSSSCYYRIKKEGKNEFLRGNFQ